MLVFHPWVTKEISFALSIHPLVQATIHLSIFNLTKPNYNATEVYNMVNWDAEVITEPPLFRNYSDEQIRSFENPQHVERCIQLMASHATSSLDPVVSDGLCKATLLERKRRPSLNSKSVKLNAQIGRIQIVLTCICIAILGKIHFKLKTQEKSLRKCKYTKGCSLNLICPFFAEKLTDGRTKLQRND